MAIYLDSADLAEIEEIIQYPFVEGVTTNPSLIAKALGVTPENPKIKRERFENHIREIAKLVKGSIFVQTNHSEEKMIVEEAKRIHEILGDRGIIKIPVSLEGMKAIKTLSTINIPTAATAVFNGVQGYIAMLSGAQFVIPYYSRLQKEAQDGLNIVEDLLDIIEANDFDCGILVASVKSGFDVLEIVRAGADAITLPADLLKELIVHHQTTLAIQNFEKALKVGS